MALQCVAVDDQKLILLAHFGNPTKSLVHNVSFVSFSRLKYSIFMDINLSKNFGKSVCVVDLFVAYRIIYWNDYWIVVYFESWTSIWFGVFRIKTYSDRFAIDNTHSIENRFEPRSIEFLSFVSSVITEITFDHKT